MAAARNKVLKMVNFILEEDGGRISSSNGLVMLLSVKNLEDEVLVEDALQGGRRPLSYTPPV